MVSSTHEAMHRIFRNHPEVVGGAFRALGFDFPETVETSVFHTDLTEYSPVERRPDTVLRVDVKGGDAFLLVIEAQRKPDPGKRRSWPYYLAYLHEKRELPVILVVVCQDRQTCVWAQETIRIGTQFCTSMTVQPLVIGPHNVPFPAAHITQEDLPLAVLAAITHGREPGVDGILRALAAALSDTDETTRTDLAVLTQLGLANLPAGRTWRSLMSFTLAQLRRSPELREILDEAEAETRAQARAAGLAEGLAEGRTAGLAEGLAEGRSAGLAAGLAAGRAADILRILDKRGVSLTEPQRGRISGCTDMETLESWLDAALEVETAEQLFG